MENNKSRISITHIPKCNDDVVAEKVFESSEKIKIYAWALSSFSSNAINNFINVPFKFINEWVKLLCTTIIHHSADVYQKKLCVQIFLGDLSRWFLKLNSKLKIYNSIAISSAKDLGTDSALTNKLNKQYANKSR